MRCALIAVNATARQNLPTETTPGNQSLTIPDDH